MEGFLSDEDLDRLADAPAHLRTLAGILDKLDRKGALGFRVTPGTEYEVQDSLREYAAILDRLLGFLEDEDAGSAEARVLAPMPKTLRRLAADLDRTQAAGGGELDTDDKDGLPLSASLRDAATAIAHVLAGVER